MVSREATKKFSKSKKEKDSKMKKERQRQGFLILIGKVSKCKDESYIHQDTLSLFSRHAVLIPLSWRVFSYFIQNIIHNLILPYLIQTNLILSYLILILIQLYFSYQGGFLTRLGCLKSDFQRPYPLLYTNAAPYHPNPLGFRFLEALPYPYFPAAPYLLVPQDF